MTWNQIYEFNIEKSCMRVKRFTGAEFKMWIKVHQPDEERVFRTKERTIKCFFFFFLSYDLFIYFWLYWVSCCMGCLSTCSKWGLFSSCGVWVSHLCGFSPVAASGGSSSCGVWVSHLCGAQVPGRAAFSGCGVWAQQLQLPGSRAQAQ